MRSLDPGVIITTNAVSPKQVTFNKAYEKAVVMSTKKHLSTVIAVSLIVLAILTVGRTQEADQWVLEHYTDMAAHAVDSRDPLGTGATFSLMTRSYYKHVGRGGVVEKIDSARINYFYSFGQLDSQVVVSGESGRFKDVDFSYPNVFEDDYVFSLFPNDTGGPEMAIAFDTDSLSDVRPIGLAVIDRAEYYPRWLYLSYPSRSNHTRYTRSFHFVKQLGLIFPDSIWIVGARAGIFSSEHYRLETGVLEIEVSR